MQQVAIVGLIDHHVVVADGKLLNLNNPLTDEAKLACTSACTPEPMMGNDSVSGVASDFATALTLIAKLPLSDAEKADAVRRLLADQTP